MQTEPRSESREGLGIALDILTQPTTAFRYLARSSHLGLGLLIYVLSQLPASLGPSVDLAGEPVPATVSWRSIIGDTVTNVIGLFVGVLFLHAAARILGGRGSYGKMVQAEAFSALPLILTTPFALLAHLAGAPVIHTFALLATLIWSFVLSIIGIRETYRISTARAVGTVVLAVVFISIPVALMVLAFGMVWLSTLGIL